MKLLPYILSSVQQNTVHQMTTANGTDKAIQSMNPLSQVVSPTRIGYYEDMDCHEYAVLEQTTPLQQSSLEVTTDASVSLTTSAEHDYVLLNRPEKQLNQKPSTDVAKQKREGASVCVHKLNGTLAAYSTLEPELGSTVPTNLDDYSKLNHHDYQRVLPDPDSDYDRTFAGSVFNAYAWTNHT